MIFRVAKGPRQDWANGIEWMMDHTLCIVCYHFALSTKMFVLPCYVKHKILSFWPSRRVLALSNTNYTTHIEASCQMTSACQTDEATALSPLRDVIDPGDILWLSFRQIQNDTHIYHTVLLRFDSAFDPLGRLRLLLGPFYGQGYIVSIAMPTKIEKRGRDKDASQEAERA